MKPAGENFQEDVNVIHQVRWTALDPVTMAGSGTCSKTELRNPGQWGILQCGNTWDLRVTGKVEIRT